MKISRSTRRGLAAAATATMAIAIVAGAVPSFAAPDTASPYVIDGTVTDFPSNADPTASGFTDASGNTSELGPVNASTTKLGVIHTAPKPMLDFTNPNAGVDLRKAWVGSKTVDATNKTWLYFAWERDSNKGSGVIMYEFQQSPEPVGCDYSGLPGTSASVIANCNPFEKRRPGDFIIVWDQVGSAAVIKVRTWALGVDNGTQGVYEPGAGDTLVLGADNVLDPSLWEAEYSADKFKGEGTLNLTDTIFKTATADCLTIGNVIPGTVTGNSDTADYKDVVLADIADKVTISSCGAVQVRKVTVPSGGTGGFSYTLSRTDGTALDYFQPTNRTTRTAGLTGDGYTAPAETDLRAGTNYTLSETIAAGTPYTLTSISCSLDGQSYAITSATSTFPVKAGKTTQCTVTNTAQQVSLTLVKTVTNDNGGTALATAWDLTALRKGTTTKVIDAAETGTPGASVTTGAGTFVLSESGGPSGYAAGSWSCVGGSQSGSEVTLTFGQSATCTINNDDQAAQLTLVKSVTNNNGGTATAGQWTLSADGPTDISGATGTTAVTSAVVAAGSYDLSESGGPAGYTASGWVCVGGTMPAGDTDTVTLGVGQSATCTITNDDQAAQLTLVKSVTNNNGGTATAGQWTLSADGPTDISGATGTTAVTSAVVAAGSYDLSESGGPAGYTASGWVCVGGTMPAGDTDTVTLGVGQSATCTITNDDQAAQLTLVKSVTNNNGGTATAGQWTLSADGPTDISGATGTTAVTSAVVAAGSYDLSESGGPAGYTASGWVCVGGTMPAGDTDTVTLGVGQSATCTITNDDAKASPSGTTIQRWVLRDSLTISGLRAGAPDAATADATFTVYDDDGCTNEVGSETVDVTGTGATTADGIEVFSPGAYYWRVSYTGDQYNNGFTTGCGEEVTWIFALDSFHDDNVPAGP